MLALNIINHLLEQNPEVTQQLSGFNGIVLSLQSASITVVGRINQHGLLVSTLRSADTTLIVPAHALSQLLQGNLPNFNELAITGDVELGMNLMVCFAQIRYNPHRDLRRVLGETTTEQLTEKASKIGKTLQIVGQTLLFQAATVNQASPHFQQQYQQLHDTLHNCLDELDTLHNEIRSINKRLEQLENKLKSHDH